MSSGPSYEFTGTIGDTTFQDQQMQLLGPGLVQSRNVQTINAAGLSFTGVIDDNSISGTVVLPYGAGTEAIKGTISPV